MSEVTKPIALDESLNTTESTPRNIADVLADELVISDLVTQAQAIVTKLQGIISAVKPNASDIPLDPITGMSANNVQDGVSELKGTLDASIIGSAVDIIGYTSSTPYTFPTDGYVILECKYGNHYILCAVASSVNMSDAFTIQAQGTGGGRGRFSLYVKKGMRFYFSQQSEGAEGTAYFRGLN